MQHANRSEERVSTGLPVRFEQLGAHVGVAALLLESKLAPAMTTPPVARLEISDGFAGSF
jgi:hypothetical protein